MDTRNVASRYGGVFTVGMAYRGTANNAAIQRLLHFAVSDVSDDVRRAAVLNLGFLLMGVPEQCPKIVSLLSESYNPHVRYGTFLVSCPCLWNKATKGPNYRFMKKYGNRQFKTLVHYC